MIPSSRKPPVYTQADKHSTRCRDGRPPAPHAKHAFALSDDGFLCFQLRVSGYVGEGAEANEGCAACRQVSPCLIASWNFWGNRTNHATGRTVVKLRLVLPQRLLEGWGLHFNGHAVGGLGQKSRFAADGFPVPR